MYLVDLWIVVLRDASHSTCQCMNTAWQSAWRPGFWESLFVQVVRSGKARHINPRRFAAREKEKSKVCLCLVDFHLLCSLYKLHVKKKNVRENEPFLVLFLLLVSSTADLHVLPFFSPFSELSIM